MNFEAKSNGQCNVSSSVRSRHNTKGKGILTLINYIYICILWIFFKLKPLIVKTNTSHDRSNS